MEYTEHFINSTVRPSNNNKMKFDENKGILSIIHEKAEENIPLLKDDEFRLVDRAAVPAVRSLYKYMDAMGRSGCCMFGQENNLQCKAGDRANSHSDTFDLTGDYPALQAFDVLAFTGVEFNIKRHNELYTTDIPGWKALNSIAYNEASASSFDFVTADIDAAASLARRAIELGGVFSLSAHMPNFVFSSVREGYAEGISPAIAKYNYKEYTPNRIEGNTVQELLAKGKGYDAFVRYLDIVAEFAKKVEKPFFFRPLHENTGSWFWWGKDHCTPGEFKELWHFIVKYLRDEKGIHNLLYAYSPGSENKNAEEYGERYPGDDYVDLVGVDMYDPDTEEGKGEEFFDRLREQLGILEAFSKAHGKLMAITETGLASKRPDPGCHATSIHMTGNLNNHWHADVLEEVSKSHASYFLLWANFSKRGTYYTPFAERINPDGTLYGHEMCDDFIRYYNDTRSVFASHQKDAVNSFS
ncbi:MAG: hypothetical protein IJ796_05210 [Lachnospiraceae bacterium]|nr:hypothetical protein [Lachnospiraceae bacterium]